MIVCPSCRHSNAEETTTCVQCGRSLEPGPGSLILRRESAHPVDELDVLPARQRSALPAILTLIGLVVVGAAVGLYFALRPDPCRDKFKSALVSPSYCVSVPLGWEQRPAAIGAQAVVDSFGPPAGVTTVLVVPFDLPDDWALADYEAYIRDQDEGNGFTPGSPSTTSLDGGEARMWDFTTRNALGETFRTREVVTVRDGFGWTVQMSDTEEGFDAHLPTFEDMLSTWHFA